MSNKEKVKTIVEFLSALNGSDLYRSYSPYSLSLMDIDVTHYVLTGEIRSDN